MAEGRRAAWWAEPGGKAGREEVGGRRAAGGSRAGREQRAETNQAGVTWAEQGRAGSPAVGPNPVGPRLVGPNPVGPRLVGPNPVNRNWSGRNWSDHDRTGPAVGVSEPGEQQGLPGSARPVRRVLWAPSFFCNAAGRREGTQEDVDG
ncbi:unnamed protein product [Linum trigynum]|uniref:Uncharacterized protein n=1 Tax=Linum trigynum TaxID=586398 RepID=A0AAV2E7M6_9ROSI